MILIGAAVMRASKSSACIGTSLILSGSLSLHSSICGDGKNGNYYTPNTSYQYVSVNLAIAFCLEYVLVSCRFLPCGRKHALVPDPAIYVLEGRFNHQRFHAYEVGTFGHAQRHIVTTHSTSCFCRANGNRVKLRVGFTYKRFCDRHICAP